MKVNYINAPGTYYTAFYCIENGKLFSAYGDETYYTPLFPVLKESSNLYSSYMITVRKQEFVDEILNSMIVNCNDHNKKFSIVFLFDCSCNNIRTGVSIKTVTF